jgi:hypothetical protein
MHIIFGLKTRRGRYLGIDGACVEVCTKLSWNYLVFWTFPSSGILENRKHDVSETGSASVLR